MAKNIAISVKQVSKSFQIPQQQKNRAQDYFLKPFQKIPHSTLQILNQISFDVRQGEFFSVIGKNGSGKSTLLKLIAGIFTPNSGTISTHGKLVPFLELGVGFNPELSGRDNIFLNGTILGMSRSYLKSKFQEIVDFSELHDFIDMPLKNYSSGMGARLAFAIAFISHANIFLLDEVFAVGDVNFQKKCLNVLQKLKKEGKTIVLVSHSMELVRSNSDRVLFLDQGKIVFITNPQDAEVLYSQHMLKAEEKQSLETFKNKPSNSIKSLRIFDKNQEENHVLESKNPISLEIEFYIGEPREHLYLRLGFFARETQAWLTDNILSSDQHAFKQGNNTIRIDFTNVPFYQGEFFIRCLLGAGDVDEKIYLNSFDSRDESLFFRYQSQEHKNALIEMDHTWSCS